MFVDTADFAISAQLMIEGYWEMWLTEALVEVVKPGMVAVDIGANLGYFTLLMADLVGATGAVHAFEPNPPIADLLARSVWVNGFHGRVTVHRDPLGEENARNVRLNVPEDIPGGAWVTADLGDSSGLALQARRFDSYPELMQADVIKIDAEAAEEDIWRGMGGFFERSSKPLMIFMEFAAPRYPDPGRFLDEMIGSGFSLGEITLDDGLVQRTRRGGPL